MRISRLMCRLLQDEFARRATTSAQANKERDGGKGAGDNAGSSPGQKKEKEAK